MTRDRLARGPALLLLGVSSVALALLASVLVPWDWVPGGSVETVRPGELFTPGQIDRAESYSGTVRPLSWASLAISLIVALALGLTPLGARVAGRLPRMVRIPGGVLLVLLAGRVATLPFSLLIREERLEAGLTRQPLSGWFRDYVVSLGVTWVLMSVALALLIWLARRTARWWFAWAAGAAVALTFTLSFAYPVAIEPLFNRFTPMPDGPLRQSLMELADDEGVPVDDVLVADASRRTTTLNAYVSGFGHTRRIVVYDNLVETAPPEQVRLVVAHELGHAQHDDVLVGTALGAVGAAGGVTLLALLLDVPRLRRRAGIAGAGDPRAVALVLALIALGTFLSSPVQNAMSRAIEARADRASLEATGDLDGFTALHQRLAVTSLSDPTPPACAHFWFGSHPTTLQRVGLARALLR